MPRLPHTLTLRDGELELRPLDPQDHDPVRRACQDPEILRWTTLPDPFTDAVVQLVNAKPEPVVFLLWGSYAQKKAAFVDTSRHLVLKAAHPSPLSAHAGFFGCRHFSQANRFLEERGLEPIDWALPQCETGG